MVETNGSWLRLQRSLWESSAFGNCMISPVENRQHEFLPAPVNPCRVSAEFGFNGLGFPGLPERGSMFEANGFTGKYMSNSQASRLAPNQHFGEPTSLLPQTVDGNSSAQAQCPQQKRFLIFDKSGDETRLIFSPLSPLVQNFPSAQTKAPHLYAQPTLTKPFGAYQFLAEGQAKKADQTLIDPCVLYEESGENEIIDEGSEMREDTEEINALLYSDDDDDDDDDGFDANYDDEDDDDDDEVSSGQSPVALDRGTENANKPGVGKDFEDDEGDLSGRCLKRRKALDGGHYEIPSTGKQRLPQEDVHGGDLICTLDEGGGPANASKRPRKGKIQDTLRVLESIIPGVKSKDPLVVLDEAISYLKRLKYNAETMFAENPDGSDCYGSPY